MSRPRFLPVPGRDLAVLFGGTAALVFLHSRPLSGWAYADWAAASAEARQSLTLAGIWAAGCAAWVSSAHSTPASVTCPVPAVRNGAPLVRAQAVLLVATAFGGLLAGLAPTYLWCAFRSTYSPDARPLVILGGVAVLVASVSFGYLCGTLMPRVLASPAAATAAFIAVAFTSAEGAVLSPVWPFDVAAGLAEPRPVAVLRIAFFLTSAALCLLASARWLEERRMTVTTLLPTALLLAPILVVILISSSSPTSLVGRDTRPQPTCISAARSQICVHPARAELLPDLAELVQSLQAVIGPDTQLPDTIADAATWPSESPGTVTLQLQDEDPSTWQAFAALDLSAELLGARTCWRDDAGSEATSPGDVTDAASVWLASRVEPRAASLGGAGPAGELADRLIRTSPEQVTPLFRRSITDLRACRATADDLGVP